MANLTTLTSLVHSLSKGEKKMFAMQTSVQSGAKDYLRLFKLISKGTPLPDLKKKFSEAKPAASFETSCKYLFRLLTKSLMHLREHSSGNKLMLGLMRASLLFEKGLHSEGFSQLKKIKQQATDRQQYIIVLYAAQLELQYYGEHSFHALTEEDLVKMQVDLDDTLRQIKNEQQHRNLYDLIRLRRMHKGGTRSANQIALNNDLLVSELGLMNMPPALSFQSQKAHLLFQAQYFLTVNNTAAALKVFHQLNELFEENSRLWMEQPSDYLFMLEGILDGLRTAHEYKALDFFLRQLQKLSTSAPVLNIVKEKLLYTYGLIPLLNTGEFAKAALFVKKNKDNMLRQVSGLDAIRRTEVYLYTALTHLVNNELEDAQKLLQPVFLDNKVYYHLPVYKTFRLIRLLVHYQLGDSLFVQSECRSLKRSMRQEGTAAYLLEKILLKFLSLHPLPSKEKDRKQVWLQLSTEFVAIESDKHERELLKIFNFPLWIQSLVLEKSFAALLKEKHQSPPRLYRQTAVNTVSPEK